MEAKSPSNFLGLNTLFIHYSSLIQAPILLAEAGCLPTRGEVKYFDEAETKEWQPLPQIASPPFLSRALIVAEKELYTFGYRKQFDTVDSESEIDLEEVHKRCFRYDSLENTWEEMPEMIFGCYREFPFVYLNNCIYAFGGVDIDKCRKYEAQGYSVWDSLPRTAEYYNMDREEWFPLPSLPGCRDWVSAVAYKGKILVYGLNLNNLNLTTENHVILVCDPSAGEDMIQTELKSKITGVKIRYPVLFVHEEVCYRILYKRVNGQSYDEQPLVNKMVLESQGDCAQLSVGEEVNQGMIPGNQNGAFCIQDQVFVNFNGFIHEIGWKINADESLDIELKKWSAGEFIKHTNVVSYTFDKKKLGIH